MKLRAAIRSGNQVLRTSNLQIGYPGKPLFSAADIELLRGECAALIGPNGAGKTTFLRTIVGTLPPLEGEAKLGASLHVGYFAQAHEALDPERTVLEELLVRREMSQGDARNYLAQYLFRGDDVWKRIASLSGGERGRLALAFLALDGANLLLLDEPTNHLDIPSQETLQAALESFEGSLLLVTHDRYLVDRLATQVWEIRDGSLHVFKGTYKELLASRDRAAQQAQLAQEAAQAQAKAAAAAAPPIANTKEERKRAQNLARLETQINETEAFLAECERKLQSESEAQRVDEVRRLAETYTATQAQLETLLEEWTALAG